MSVYIETVSTSILYDGYTGYAIIANAKVAGKIIEPGLPSERLHSL